MTSSARVQPIPAWPPKLCNSAKSWLASVFSRPLNGTPVKVTMSFTLLSQCLHRFVHNSRSRLLLAALIVFFSGTSFAQTVNLGDDVSRPTPGAGHDYIYLLNETVNPANGSLSIKIDLPAPKGRGLSLPFAITYNSGEVNHFSSLQAGVGVIAGLAINNITSKGQPNTF